ncbi:MAG: peptidoglycan DD-metalloendopeptidase family protein [Rhodobacteraceae bacterium]|nr:peptidoglycan DD-metalloendopeptidase family protein [Paracoccaceae bacterium]MCW9043318.1 peptidoglycan DD-metalloendopeptidase family protein [Pseudopelagicola sp.]
MRAFVAAALVALGFTGSVSAEGGTSPAEAAKAAAEQIEAASLALQVAGAARDRVAALTDTVQGFEAGLQAMREGLRRAAAREARIRRDLKRREDETARLLGVLQSMGQGMGPDGAPVMLLHPDGPVGTARAGMILADVTPALETGVSRLRADLKEIEILRTLQQDAAQTLQEGLGGIQTARAELSQAIADRTDLPQRFADDPVKIALLIASTETLNGFASGLVDIQETGDSAVMLPDLEARKGELRLPVEAQVLRRAGEADAAGVRRPGIVLAARPSALVVSPTAATIRYRGPLLEYGNVIILEAQPGLLFVFAGMATVYGDAGQVIPEGTPVGLMGGNDAEIGAILSQVGDGSGQGRTETLYIEVRQGKTTVDPETWFRTDKDEL